MRARTSNERAPLAALVLLALALRFVGAENIFVGGGDVVFFVGDAYFHVDRALASLARFPGFLSFDHYLNFPAGATVPSPPGYDLLAAGIALALGGTEHVLEVVEAVMPAVLGAATVIPVWVLGRRVGGPRAGLLAAFFVAVWPANAIYGLLGYADHHVLVALLVASWIALAASIAAGPLPRRALVLRAAGLWAVRTALVATWSGSILYLALGDGALVLALVLTRSGVAPLAALAASLAATAAAIAPLVAASPTPLGGPLSAIDLSWLQPIACAALAVWTAALAQRARRAPGRTALRGVGEAMAIGALALALLFALPGVARNVGAGIAFVAKTDAWGDVVIEQLPLFSRAPGAVSATMLFGWLAYAVPLAPLVPIAMLRAAATRGVALVLLPWSLALAALTLSQNRYACDFSVVGAVLFAHALAAGAGAAARRISVSMRAAGFATAAAAAVLVAPAFTRLHGPALNQSLGAALALARGVPLGDRALATVHGTVFRFAQEIRRTTPETAGFQTDAQPEYGILCDPSIGYTVQYTARRPTPASNAGPYVGAENAFAVRRFRAAASEAEALAIAEPMRSRYVVTEPRAEYGPQTLLHRLHADDGAARAGLPRFERFRLVTEGPAGGTPLAAMLGDLPAWGTVPYKLFEIVPGAVLDVPGAPGTAVAARVAIRTTIGRTFGYVAEGVADETGHARLRVPYATDTTAPTRPIAPWRITAGDAVYRVTVRDADVRTGATVTVGARDAEPR